MINRCLNLDWLEVHVWEPIEEARDALYFERHGFEVIRRDYGTRVFGEMFTVCAQDTHAPFIEVRRAPKTSLLQPNDVHLRLVNRYCYFDAAAQLMADFIFKYSFEFVRIVRVDLALDFERFDYGDRPKVFLQRYIAGCYSKINQANVNAHGTDTWTSRNWNSISWGAPSSDVGTKFYNKTLELYDPIKRVFAKPYIMQAWLMPNEFGDALLDAPVKVIRADGNGIEFDHEIWRLEFSIRSSVRRWFLINRNGNSKDKQSIRNTLDMYDSRHKMLVLFASLTQHYFHFKHFDPVRRKDRCLDKRLFKWPIEVPTYKVGKDVAIARADKPDNSIIRLISLLTLFRDTTLDSQLKRLCAQLVELLAKKQAQSDAKMYNTIELKAMQAALREHLANPSKSYVSLYREIKNLLHLNDDTCPFF